MGQVILQRPFTGNEGLHILPGRFRDDLITLLVQFRSGEVAFGSPAPFVLFRPSGSGVNAPHDLRGTVGHDVQVGDACDLDWNDTVLVGCASLVDAREATKADSTRIKLVVQAQSQPDNIATLPLLTATFVRPVRPVARGEGTLQIV